MPGGKLRIEKTLMNYSLARRSSTPEWTSTASISQHRAQSVVRVLSAGSFSRKEIARTKTEWSEACNRAMGREL